MLRGSLHGRNWLIHHAGQHLLGADPPVLDRAGPRALGIPLDLTAIATRVLQALLVLFR